MSDHVAVEPALTASSAVQYAERYLRLNVDPQLRLRRSVMHPGFYVLERRASRAKPAEPLLKAKDGDGNVVERVGLTDQMIAARDGYHFLSHVHPSIAESATEIERRLKANGNDLHASGQSAERYWQQMRDAEQAADAQWDKDLDSHLSHHFREGFDVLNRLGDPESHAGRFRISAPGPVVPAHETSPCPTRDVDVSTGDDHAELVSPASQQDRQLHD